jgi:hypothetical protein
MAACTWHGTIKASNFAICLQSHGSGRRRCFFAPHCRRDYVSTSKGILKIAVSKTARWYSMASDQACETFSAARSRTRRIGPSFFAANVLTGDVGSTAQFFASVLSAGCGTAGSESALTGVVAITIEHQIGWDALQTINTLLGVAMPRSEHGSCVRANVTYTESWTSISELRAASLFDHILSSSSVKNDHVIESSL